MAGMVGNGQHNAMNYSPKAKFLLMRSAPLPVNHEQAA